jgi:receptor expression-enhancing protein 5/6
LKKIDALLGHFEFVVKLEKQTHLRKSHMLLGLLSFMALVVLWQSGWSAVCNAVGFFYPVYASFKALRTEEADDDTEWLTYWVVYGSFIFSEDFFDFLVPESLEWTGFVYYMLKIAFLLWLMLPQTRGAGKVFQYIVEPIVSRFEVHIDKNLNKVVRGANVIYEEGQKKVVETAVQSVVQSAMRSRKAE